MGTGRKIKQGSTVRATGKIAQVPVGPDILGRVVDALVNPLDGKGPIGSTETRLIESPAPGIITRQSVCEPLQTGILSIDAMIPIGRGQRINYWRQTNRKNFNCFRYYYQSKSEDVGVYTLQLDKSIYCSSSCYYIRRKNALSYTVIVAANASDPATLQYLAPYTGSIAEYFMYKGKATLIIYDDLTKQAQAYRQMSLLLRRPPGREASQEMYSIYIHVY
jgi:F-type H+-transporting ATPase subunit alpha